VALVRKRTTHTELTPLVNEVNANVLSIDRCRVVSAAEPCSRNLGSLDRLSAIMSVELRKVKRKEYVACMVEIRKLKL
jgi:hypothetical protein